MLNKYLHARIQLYSESRPAYKYWSFLQENNTTTPHPPQNEHK